MSSLTVISYTDPDKLEEDCIVTDSGLTDAMKSQAGLLSWYGSRFAEATRQAAYFRRTFNTVEGQLYDLATEHFLTLEPEKTPTEGKIKSWIKRDKRFQNMARLVDEALYEESIAKLAFEAIKERRRMINDLGNYRREEMRGNITHNAILQTTEGRAERRNAFMESRKRLVQNIGGIEEGDIITHETE